MRARVPMSPVRRAASACAPIVLLAGALGGCLKYRDHTVLLPDGSGKLTLTVGLKTAMMDLAEAAAAERGEEGGGMGIFEMDPDRLRQDFEGFTAFTEPERKTDGDWTTLTLTGYFDDIRRVKMWSNGVDEEDEGDDAEDDAEDGGAERELMLAFTLQKEGEGFVLTQTSGIFDDVAELGEPDPEDPDLSPEARKAADEMARTMMKSMFEGLELSSTVEMPGKVTKAEGHEPKDGRIAASTITVDDLTETKRKEKLAARAPIRVWCGAPDVSAEQVKALRAEAAAAKKAWEARVAAWDAKRAAGAGAPAGAGGADAPKAPPAPAGTDGGSKLPPELR